MSQAAAAIQPLTSAGRTRAADIIHRLNLAAHDDFNVFCERVIKDDITGKPITQAPVHEAWAEIAEKHDKLVLWSAIEHGKTTQMSIARPLWLLGRNPNLRIAIVSKNHSQARKIVHSMKRILERSDDYHQIFPHVVRDTPWTDTSLTIRRRTDGTKDPSIQCVGTGGNILGSRVDLLVMDDVLSLDNTRTREQREKVWEWYHAMLSGRMTAKGRILVVGTAWHPEDLLHRLARQPGFKAVRYPVFEADGVTPRWPERWSKERIEGMRAIPVHQFDAQLLCTTRSNETARFKDEWIAACLNLGRGKTIARGWNGEPPPGFKCYTGVDLAIQKGTGNDKTAIFSICVAPPQFGSTIRVLECLAMPGGVEAKDAIVNACNRWRSRAIVENNAAQDFLVQDLKRVGCDVIGHTTTANGKAHPEWGIEAMANEMRNERWIIPSPDGVHPARHQMRDREHELAIWIEELRNYDPDQHTGDRLMASWLAREGIRLNERNKASNWNINIRSR